MTDQEFDLNERNSIARDLGFADWEEMIAAQQAMWEEYTKEQQDDD